MYINPSTPGLAEQRGMRFFSNSPPTVGDGGPYNHGNSSGNFVPKGLQGVPHFSLGDRGVGASPPMSPGFNYAQKSQSFDFSNLGRSSPAHGEGNFTYSFGDSQRHMHVPDQYVDQGGAYAGYSTANQQYSQKQTAQSRQTRGPLTRSRSLKERPKKSNNMAKRRLSLELIPEQDLIAAGIIKVPSIQHNLSDLTLQADTQSPRTGHSEFVFSPPPTYMHSGTNLSPKLPRRDSSSDFGSQSSLVGSSPHSMVPSQSGVTHSPQNQRRALLLGNTANKGLGEEFNLHTHQQLQAQISQIHHMGSEMTEHFSSSARSIEEYHGRGHHDGGGLLQIEGVGRQSPRHHQHQQMVATTSFVGEEVEKCLCSNCQQEAILKQL